MPTSSQIQRKRENEQFLATKEVKAFLYTIAASEGTLDKNGRIEYGRIVKGLVVNSPFDRSMIGKRDVVITDFSRHPEILVKCNNRGLQSSAAGFLQAIRKTWKMAVLTMGITDFSPHSQELVAVELIRQRGAMSYILRGDLAGAFKNSKLRLEWASFPGAGYGQHENSLAKLQAVFSSAMQRVGQNSAV